MIEFAKNTSHASVPLKRIMFRARDFWIKLCFYSWSYQLLHINDHKKTYTILGTILKQ